MLSIEERVSRGCSWLDWHRPGWRDAISLEHINLDCPHNCILGQTGGWSGGVTSMRDDRAPVTAEQLVQLMIQHGFLAKGPRDADALTSAWRSAIHASSSAAHELAAL